MREKRGWMLDRWLGVGLAGVLAVVTLGLAVTGRLGLFINPSSNWFAIPMALLLLVGAALTFLLPLGAEADHGHAHGDAVGADHDDHDHLPLAPRGSEATESKRGDPTGGVVSTRFARSTTGGVHDHDHVHDHVHDHDHDHDHDHLHPERAHTRTRRHARAARATRSPGHAHGHDHAPRGPFAVAMTATGAVLATGVVLATLVFPPAALSAEIAQTRTAGPAPLFAGTDLVTLATRADTSAFGVGDWANVFATATNPEAFDGDAVHLVGFVTPGRGSGGFALTRMVIRHCVIDAQAESVGITATGKAPATGVWVEVSGTVRTGADGGLKIEAATVKPIAEPKDPYEY